MSETLHADLAEHCMRLEAENALLTAQVAMQAEVLEYYIHITSLTEVGKSRGKHIEEVDDGVVAQQALSATAETVAAWKRENDAKVLETKAHYILSTINHLEADDHSFEDGKQAVAIALLKDTAELRATKDKEAT